MPPKTQTVVITGASVGVGRATAHAFAAEGARVALLARSPESLRTQRTEGEFGPIDVWVNGIRGVYSDMAKDSSMQLQLTRVVPDWAARMVSAAAGRAFGELQKRLGG